MFAEVEPVPDTCPPLKFNLDTKNDGLENVSPASNKSRHFGYQFVKFEGIKIQVRPGRYTLHLGVDGRNPKQPPGMYKTL